MHNAYILLMQCQLYMYTMYYTMHLLALKLGRTSGTRLVAVGLIKELYAHPPLSYVLQQFCPLLVVE